MGAAGAWVAALPPGPLRCSDLLVQVGSGEALPDTDAYASVMRLSHAA